MEREKYAVGVKWLHDVLFGLQFSPERVAVVATKMVNDVARYGEDRLVLKTYSLPRLSCLQDEEGRSYSFKDTSQPRYLLSW